MDFLAAIDRLMPQIRRVVEILNSEEINPVLRKQAMTSAFQRIGQTLYGKTYHMTAFDLEIFETIGRGFSPELALGLARNISNGIATGDNKLALDQAKNFLNSSTSSAMFDAVTTAKQLGKYIVVTRSLRKETCPWCRARVGKYTNPTDDIYRRHTHCDCLIIVKGFKSRNGELKNYRPA